MLSLWKLHLGGRDRRGEIRTWLPEEQCQYSTQRQQACQQEHWDSKAACLLVKLSHQSVAAKRGKCADHLYQCEPCNGHAVRDRAISASTKPVSEGQPPDELSCKAAKSCAHKHAKKPAAEAIALVREQGQAT